MSDYTVGQRLGDYEILGVLGAGGMGKVYKVRNVISDRVEAMKILLPNLASQKDLADRFLREIKLLGTLSHPNIASLRTALTLDNQLVMIMEYVDGVTLSSRVQQGAIPAAGRGEVCGSGAGGAELRAQAGHRAPRHQAGQHDVDSRWLGEADGFWDRAVGQRSQFDGHGDYAGLAELHAAGTGEGRDD